MIQPGVYNIKLQRRADFSLLLEFKDVNKSPIDLTGWDVVAQIWDLARSTKYADFDVEYVSRPNGSVRLLLDYADTEELPNEATYDVLLVNPAGKREYYLEGSVMVAEGFTDVP